MKLKWEKLTTIAIGIMIFILILSASYIFITKEIIGVEEKDIKLIIKDSFPGTIDIYDNKIVYDEWEEGEAQIVLFDLSPKDKIKINEFDKIVSPPKISRNNIVYITITSEDNLQIKLYQISMKQIVQLTNENGYPGKEPSIFENKIVWLDRRHDEPGDDTYRDEIYLYDINTNKEQRLTSTSFMKSVPDIYENNIVWSILNDKNELKIKLYDLTTDKITEVGDGGLVRIWDDKVVCQKKNKEGYHALFVIFLSNDKEIEIPKSTGRLMGYDVDNNKVVWCNGNEIIYLYDISKDKLTEIINVESTRQIGVWSPAIWGSKVVFGSNKDGEPNIYLYTIKDDEILGLEPTTFYFSMITLIIILVIILVLMVRRNRRKGRLEKINKEIHESISSEIETEQDIMEAEIIEPKPPPRSESQPFQCPNCNKSFKVSEQKRPVTIKCPHCGVEGVLK